MKFIRRLVERFKRKKKFVNTQKLSPYERRKAIFEMWEATLAKNRKDGVKIQKITVEQGMKVCENYIEELEKKLTIVPLTQQWEVKDEIKKARNQMLILIQESKKV